MYARYKICPLLPFYESVITLTIENLITCVKTLSLNEVIRNCINQIIVVKNMRHILNLEYVWRVSYLDLHLEIDSKGRLRMNLYDKRDALNITIANVLFPSM